MIHNLKTLKLKKAQIAGITVGCVAFVIIIVVIVVVIVMKKKNRKTENNYSESQNELKDVSD